MVRLLFAALSIVLMLTSAFGCSGTSSTAPKAAGDPAALAGTSWLDPGSNTVYTFKDGATLEVKLSAAPQPVQGPYSVENGVISGATGMQSFDGTWDGKSVTMRGKALVKQ